MYFKKLPIGRRIHRMKLLIEKSIPGSKPWIDFDKKSKRYYADITVSLITEGSDTIKIGNSNSGLTLYK